MNRNRMLTTAALAAALALSPAAVGQQSVEECIAQNGPRYDTPGDATTHQYVDTGGLCADAQNDDTDVDITPIGGKTPKRSGDKPPSRVGSKTPSRPDLRTKNGAKPGKEDTPTPQTVPVPEPSSGAPTQTSATPVEPAPTQMPRPAQPPRAGARGASATSAVNEALTTGGTVKALSPPVGVNGIPGGIGAAALLSLGLAGAGLGARRLGRR